MDKQVASSINFTLASLEVHEMITPPQTSFPNKRKNDIKGEAIFFFLRMWLCDTNM